MSSSHHAVEETTMEVGPEEPDPGLTRRLRSGLIWLYVSKYTGKLIFFGATLILARLLTPDDFALVAFALAILGLAEAADLGVGAALVWLDREKAMKSRSVVFTLNNISILLLSIAFWFLAPPIADILSDDPNATWVFRALIPVLLLRALGLTHENLLKREMDFRKRFLPEFCGGIVKGVLAVVLALSGFGVWALVGGVIAGQAVRTTGLWIVVPFRPRFDLGLDGRAKVLITYGANVSFIALLTYVAGIVDYFLVGSLLGATVLGFYVIAYRIPEIVLEEGLQTASQALFPYYSRSREAGESASERFLGTTKISALIATPIVAILAGMATPIIVIYFGGKWEPAAEALPGLAISAALLTISGFAGDMYLALGKPWLQWVLGVPSLIVLIAGLWFVAPEGIAAIAWFLVVFAVVESVIKWDIVCRITDTRRRAIAASLLPAVLTGIPTALAAVAISQTTPAVFAALAGPVIVLLVFAVACVIFVPEASGYLKRLRDWAPLARRQGAA